MLVGTSTSPRHTRHQQDRPCLRLSRPATACDMSRSARASACICVDDIRLLTRPRAAGRRHSLPSLSRSARMRLCVTLRAIHSNDDDNDDTRNALRSSALLRCRKGERVRQRRPMPVSLPLRQRLTAAAVAPVTRDPDGVLELGLTANSDRSRSGFLRACRTACNAANAHRGSHTCFVRGSMCDADASPRARGTAGTPRSRG